MRILFVAFPDSIHAARWANQVTEMGWDVHLFPSRNEPLHPDFRNITTYGFSAFRPEGLSPSVRWRQLWPRRGLSRLSALASRYGPRWLERSYWLARVIRGLRPDLVHSLEFQSAGYLTLAAKGHLAGEGFPRWAASNWGSDIYLYGRLPEHAEKIRAVLANCDYYHCECARDVELARRFGFRGEVFPVCPVSGGFDVAPMRELRQPGRTSARRVIALKGYQNWAGRALVALRAMGMCADALAGYTVQVYLASPEVKLAARLLAADTGLRVEVTEGGLRHADILRLHGSARVSVGLSISDAISTSLVEAMIMGSFPVQSETSCATEWLRDGEGAIFVPAEDPRAVADAIRRAVSDDRLVDAAAESNYRTAFEKFDASVVRPGVVGMYESIAARSARGSGRHSN